VSDDLTEIMSRDPRQLTLRGPEIEAIIAFYRSKRKDFLFPKEKPKAKKENGAPVKMSLDDLLKGA
jgi:hypothetical protein